MRSAIDKAGRIVIPKPIRDAAGLKPGTAIDIGYSDGRIEIEPIGPKIKLLRKGSMLVASSRAPKLTVKEVNEWIRKSRHREND